MNTLFDAVSKRIPIGKIVPHILLPVFVLFAASCKQKATQSTVENGDLAETAIHRLDTMLFSTPNTIEIHQDSLIRKPVREKKIKAG